MELSNEYLPFIPWDADSLELEVCDLPFAIKKTNKMENEITKLNFEKMRLRSEIRGLKKLLQEYGHEFDDVWSRDPLVDYYERENTELKRRIDKLEHQIRNLQDDSVTQDFNNNPCKFIKTVMQNLRESHRAELEKQTEIIEDLISKLAQAKEENSCSVLNELKSKFQEMMKDKQYLLSQNSELDKKTTFNDSSFTVESKKTSTKDGSEDIESGDTLSKDLKNIENLDRASFVNLKDVTESEKMSVDDLNHLPETQETLDSHIETEQQRELKDATNVDELIDEIERLRKEKEEIASEMLERKKEIDELKLANDKLLSKEDQALKECTAIKTELSEKVKNLEKRNAELLERNENLEKSLLEKNKTVTKADNTLDVENNRILKHDLEEREAVLMYENKTLNESLTKLKEELNKEKNVKIDFEKNISNLNSELNKIRAEKDELNQTVQDLTKNKENCERQLEIANNKIDSLKLQLDEANNELTELKKMNEILKVSSTEADKFKGKQEYKVLNENLSNKSTTLQNQNDKLNSELSELKNVNKNLLDNLNQARNQLDVSENELKICTKELTKIRNQLQELKNKAQKENHLNQENKTVSNTNEENLITRPETVIPDAKLNEQTKTIQSPVFENKESYDRNIISATTKVDKTQLYIKMLEDELADVKERLTECVCDRIKLLQQIKIFKLNSIKSKSVKSKFNASYGIKRFRRYILANNEFKKIVLHQAEAVERVRKLICYLKNNTPVEYEITSTKLSVENTYDYTDPNIQEVFKSLQYLTDNIFYMEQELRQLTSFESATTLTYITKCLQSLSLSELALLHREIREVTVLKMEKRAICGKKTVCINKCDA